MPTGTNLPKGWSLVQLSQLMKFQNGLNSDKSAYGRGLRFANVLEVITHSHLFANMIPGRVITSVSETNRYLVQKGDLLFNRTSETQEEVGLASVYLDDEPILFGGFVLRGKPISDALDPVFAGYGLRSKIVREQIIAAGQGGIRANIGQQSLSKIKVALPGKFEQKAIAEALSDADALIEGLERLIAKKRLIKQGAMQELLTGRRRLPGFSEEWVEHKLSEISSFGKGKGLPKSDVKLSGDISCIHYGSLFREQPTVIESLETFTVDFLGAVHSQAGEVLMPTSDVTPSGLAIASCILSDGVLLGGDILIIRPHPDRLDGRFLASYIRQARNQIMELVSGTTVFHIYSSDMARFKVKLPPLDEQQSIVSLLTDMDAEIQALETRLEKARQIKEGMMQNLLTGRIRLV